jgi:hypothetical protein
MTNSIIFTTIFSITVISAVPENDPATVKNS